MKTIRLLAGIVLILDGILHIVASDKTGSTTGNSGPLIFGILYLMTGLLIFIGKRTLLYAGFIVPLVGMTVSMIKYGVPELTSWSALFKLLGVLVMILCGYLLLNQKKEHVHGS